MRNVLAPALPYPSFMLAPISAIRAYSCAGSPQLIVIQPAIAMRTALLMASQAADTQPLSLAAAGGEGQARRRAVIKGWEEQAAELLQAADLAQAAAGGAAAAYSRFLSLKATIKERRRAVKGLMIQAVAQRSTQAHAALVRTVNRSHARDGLLQLSFAAAFEA